MVAASLAGSVILHTAHAITKDPAAGFMFLNIEYSLSPAQSMYSCIKIPISPDEPAVASLYSKNAVVREVVHRESEEGVNEERESEEGVNEETVKSVGKGHTLERSCGTCGVTYRKGSRAYTDTFRRRC